MKTPIAAVIGQTSYLITIPITALIDTGCLQTNVVSSRVADLLVSKGKASIQRATRALRPGVGGSSYGVNSIIEFDIEFDNTQDTSRVPVRIFIKALISHELDFDLIIGLPTIQHFHLLDTLAYHFKSLPPLCEVCADSATTQCGAIPPQPTISLNSLVSNPSPSPPDSSHDLAEVLETLHLSDIFDIEEDEDELYDEADITSILKQGADGDLTIDIQGSTEMKAQLQTLVA
jgi:hypothetical protein